MAPCGIEKEGDAFAWRLKAFPTNRWRRSTMSYKQNGEIICGQIGTGTYEQYSILQTEGCLHRENSVVIPGGVPGSIKKKEKKKKAPLCTMENAASCQW